MKLRRYPFIALAALAVAAPAFAGGHIDMNTGPDQNPGSGGVTTPLLNVLILDTATDLPIIGASGQLWSIPKQSWEPPVVVSSAVTGESGKLYFVATGYKAGDVFNVEVTANNFAPFTTLVWLSKGATTVAEIDMVLTQTGPKQGIPSNVKGTVASTWGQIKALY